jgi:hypothetical protein
MSEGFSRPRLTASVALCIGMAIALAACGGDNNGHGVKHAAAVVVPTATPTPNPAVASACVPSGAMAVDVNASNGQVSVYAPAGEWGSSTTGVFLVPVEAGGVIGAGVTRATVATANPVNSCSANSATGRVICSANNHDAYLIDRTTLTAFTLTSAGVGTESFSGGTCTNCNAIADPVMNLGIIGIAGTPAGYQFFDLSSGLSDGVVGVPGSGSVLSESPAIEPTKHFLLSANEDQDFQIINFSTTAPGGFRYAQRSTVLAASELDGTAIDCTTDIALAADEFNNQVFVTDLTQATFTPGSGATFGTWNAPAQLQPTPGLLGITTTGLAVAPSGHVGIMQQEFGTNNFAAFSLPATSGTGTPGLTDWVAALVPTQPDTATWSNTFDPHGLTAYTSPTTGSPMGVLLNAARTFILVIDINKLLAAPRTGAHTVQASYDLVANGVVTFVSVH